MLLGCGEVGLRPLEAATDVTRKARNLRKDWESSDVVGATRSRAVYDRTQSRTSYAPSMTPIFNEYVEHEIQAGSPAR